MIRLNPVFQKELKTNVRGIKTSFVILGFNGLLALFGLFSFFITFEYDSKYGGSINYSDILKIYEIIVATEFGLVLFTVPAFTATSISGERERQTLEILLTTKLSPFKIVIGKLASSISFMILLAISSMPILALVFTIGGITIKDLLEFFVLIIVTAIFVGSIGIFFSCFFKKTAAATVATYGSLIFICLGTLLILWVIALLAELSMSKQVSDSIAASPNLGNGILLLLVNPAVTCFSLIEDQIGTGSRLVALFDNFGTVSDQIQSIWFLISISLQLILSALFIWASTCVLNPLKDKCLLIKFIKRHE